MMYNNKIRSVVREVSADGATKWGGLKQFYITMSTLCTIWGMDFVYSGEKTPSTPGRLNEMKFYE